MIAVAGYWAHDPTVTTTTAPMWPRVVIINTSPPAFSNGTGEPRIIVSRPEPRPKQSPFDKLLKRFPRMLPEFCAADLAPKRDEKTERGPETEPSRLVRFRTNRVGRAVGESWRVML